MATGKVKKQSWEAYPISASILKWQPDDSTEVVELATSTVIAEDKDGTNVSDTFMNQGTKTLDSDPDGDFTDNMLSMKFASEGGLEAASPFKVTFRMITDEGNYYEADYIVTVKEI